MPKSKSKRQQRRAREQQAREEQDEDTENEQQEEQDNQENDSVAEARKTGIKTAAPLIKGNPADKSASYMTKFLDEAVHYLRESKGFRDDAREER